MPLLIPKRTQRRVWRLLPLAILLACCLYATGFWMCAPMPDLPWPEAADQVQTRWQAGDAVAVRPWWASRVREYLGQRPVYQVRDLNTEDLSRHGRLWVFVLPGYAHQLQGPFSDGRYKLLEQNELDGLELRLYQLPPPAKRVYDFREHLKEARVTIAAKGRPKNCAKWNENRWVCSRHNWNHVGRMILEVGADPREVIWAHPTDEGPIEIAFAQVPHGSQLHLNTGLLPLAANMSDGAPVQLEVVIDGHSRAKFMQPNRSVWLSHTLDLSALPAQNHRIVFRVSSKRSHMRQFCFAAEVRQ